jgi:hypothetical protein
MSRKAAALGPLFALALGIAVLAPASSAASGQETFSGLITTSGRSGERQVLASTVIARGVFNGTGRIVEVASQPGDSDDLQRDDLVFADGSLHLLSTNVDAAFDLDPKSCRYHVLVSQVGEIAGGTGIFANASGSSAETVNVSGLLARNADRSCSFDQAPVSEIDTISSSGTLAF